MGSSIDLPNQHKAAVYDKPGAVSTEVKLIDTPEPGYGQVLINLSVAKMHTMAHI
jgi:propanol-preferring alcohol dehydrogenase